MSNPQICIARKTKSGLFFETNRKVYDNSKCNDFRSDFKKIKSEYPNCEIIVKYEFKLKEILKQQLNNNGK